jgi:hypothetical protein
MGAIEQIFERIEKEIAELKKATRLEKIRRIATEEITATFDWIAEKNAIDAEEERIKI